MKKTVVFLVAVLVFTFLLTACEQKEKENLDTSATVSTNSSESNLENQDLTAYKYKAYGLQNVTDIPYQPKYEEEYNCYNVYFAKARCPECRSEVSISPKIYEKDFGKQTIVWEDSVCCTAQHENEFFFGWFDVAVQFIRIDE